MKLIKEFKTFAVRGNVIDLAVGIVIGAAFTGIVQSLVNDILTPVLGLFTGGVDFSNLYINLSGSEYPSLAAAQQAGAATINYGLFLNAVLSFLIVAWAVFVLVKVVNRLAVKAEDPKDKSVPTPKEILLLTEIRDLLAEGRENAVSRQTGVE